MAEVPGIAEQVEVPFNNCGAAVRKDTREWSVKADLPVLRDSAACAVVDGELWLMGGLNRALGETDSVFVYDIESDSWAAGPALPQKLRGCAAVHEEKVYLFYDRGLLVRDSTGWVDVAITAGGVGVRCAPGSIFLG